MHWLSFKRRADSWSSCCGQLSAPICAQGRGHNRGLRHHALDRRMDTPRFTEVSIIRGNGPARDRAMARRARSSNVSQPSIGQRSATSTRSAPPSRPRLPASQSRFPHDDDNDDHNRVRHRSTSRDVAFAHGSHTPRTEGQALILAVGGREIRVEVARVDGGKHSTASRLR